MSHVILIAVSFSITACQSVNVSGCPPLVEYSALTQKKAAEELRSLPKDSQIAKLVIDYNKMRKACRLND